MWHSLYLESIHIRQAIFTGALLHQSLQTHTYLLVTCEISGLCGCSKKLLTGAEATLLLYIPGLHTNLLLVMDKKFFAEWNAKIGAWKDLLSCISRDLHKYESPHTLTTPASVWNCLSMSNGIKWGQLEIIWKETGLATCSVPSKPGLVIHSSNYWFVYF